MKERLKKTIRGRLRLLELTLTKGERVDYARAEWLAGSPSPCLLDFTYRGQGKGARLDYDVMGTQQLTAFLGAPVTSGQYERLLRTIGDLVELCVEQDISTSNVWWDEHGVFVDDRDHLRFVLVPVVGVLRERHSSPLGLLSWLGSPRHVRTVVEDDERHVLAVGDWSQRQSVFSPEKFARMLDDEFLPARPQGTGSGPLSSGGSLSTQQVRTASSRSRGSAVNPLEVLGVELESLAASPVGRVAEEAYEAAPSGELAGAEPAVGSGEDSTSSLGSAPLGDAAGAGAAPVRIVRVSDGRVAMVPSITCSLGRSSTCDLQFGDNTNISRLHVMVCADADGITIIDQGSANGTFVRGRRVDPQVPHHVGRGELFRLADEDFRVE